MPSSVLSVAAKQALPRSSAVREAAARYIPDVERNVASTERLVSLGLGACLTVFGLTRPTRDRDGLAEWAEIR